MTTCDVLGINYAVSSVDAAVQYVLQHIDELRGSYICFSNVHTTILSTHDDEYRRIQNGSAITFPDGAPIAREQRHSGYKDARRVAGPDFMEAIFSATKDGSFSHYFYGSTEETIHLLQKLLPENYPGIKLAGCYSPSFKPLESITQEEDLEDIMRLNSSGADLIWVGLGAPKQERWMAKHIGQLNGVMLGVGAGFDFYAGTVKRAPEWIKKAGVEWLFRLLQDPIRLWKRYAVTNTEFIIKIIKTRLR